MVEMSSILEKFSRYVLVMVTVTVARHGPLSWGQVSQATEEVVKELKQGDHGDSDLLAHITKALDQSIHGSSLLHKVRLVLTMTLRWSLRSFSRATQRRQKSSGSRWLRRRRVAGARRITSCSGNLTFG